MATHESGVERFVDLAATAVQFGRWDLVDRWVGIFISDSVGAAEPRDLARAGTLLTSFLIRDVTDVDSIGEALEQASTEIVRRGVPKRYVEASARAVVLRNGMAAGWVQVGAWLRSELMCRPDLTIAVCTKAVAMDPQRAAAHITRAAAHLDLGNITDADVDIEVAERLSRGGPHLHNLKRRRSRMLGEMSDSEEEGYAGVEVKPGDGEREKGYAFCVQLLSESEFESCLMWARAMDRQRSTQRTRDLIRRALRGIAGSSAA